MTKKGKLEQELEPCRMFHYVPCLAGDGVLAAWKAREVQVGDDCFHSLHGGVGVATGLPGSV